MIEEYRRFAQNRSKHHTINSRTIWGLGTIDAATPRKIEMYTKRRPQINKKEAVDVSTRHHQKKRPKLNQLSRTQYST